MSELEVRAEVLEIGRTERIAVKSNKRFPGDIGMAKAVPGHRWAPQVGVWHYPLTMNTCHLLRQTYTDLLVVGPSLARWFRQEQAENERLRALGASSGATLTRVPEMSPVMADAMASRPWQQSGARFLAETRRCLLADEPTLGKSIQYLGGLMEADLWHGVHLICAPKTSLKTVWADEINQWSEDGSGFWMPEGYEARMRMWEMFLDDDHPAKFLIINPEMLQTQMKQYCNICEEWGQGKKHDQFGPEHSASHDQSTRPQVFKQKFPHLHKFAWDSICVDEAQKYLLGLRSARDRTQVAEGLIDLVLRRNGMKVALTGTPARGRPMSFWSIFHWLDPKAHSSKWAFAESYCEISKDVFGTTIGDLRSDREQMLYTDFNSIMLRRTKKECQPDLPEDQIIDHWVDMLPDQDKQYQELLDEGETTFEGGSITTKGLLEEFTRQKQWAYGSWRAAGGRMVPKNSPKLDFLLEQLEERGIFTNGKGDWRPEGTGFKHVVVSQFSDVLKHIWSALRDLGINAVMIDGGVSLKSRTAVISQFQRESDPVRILLLQVKAGGEAITLDAWCDDMWLLDETWRRDDMIQVEGRIKNRNPEKRTATRNFHYIRTRNTIEEEIAESGLSQDEFQKTLLDRRRGVEFATRTIKDLRGAK